LLAQRLQVGEQGVHVLALELLLGAFQPPRVLLALAHEPSVLLAQPLHQRGRLLHALGEQVEVGVHHGRFVHFSLSRAPRRAAAAAGVRSWIVWPPASASVRSGCWNWSANARLFMPSGVPGPA